MKGEGARVPKIRARPTKETETSEALRAYESRHGTRVADDGCWALAFAAYVAADEWLWKHRRAHFDRVRKKQPTPPWPAVPAWILLGLVLYGRLGLEGVLTTDAATSAEAERHAIALDVTIEGLHVLREAQKTRPFAIVIEQIALGETVRTSLNKATPLPNLSELVHQVRAACGEEAKDRSDASLLAESIDLYTKIPSLQRSERGNPRNFTAEFFAFFLATHRERQGRPLPTLADTADLYLAMIGEDVSSREEARSLMRRPLARALAKLRLLKGSS